MFPTFSPQGGWLTAGLAIVLGLATPAPSQPEPADLATADRAALPVQAAPTDLVLHDGCGWMRMPHGSLLHLPETPQSKVGAPFLGTVLSWSEFMNLDRATLGRSRVA